MKLVISPIIENYFHREDMEMFIRLEYTPEEKKNKKFWLYIWRINHKATHDFIAWAMINVMQGIKIHGIQQKYLKENYQRVKDVQLQDPP